MNGSVPLEIDIYLFHKSSVILWNHKFSQNSNNLPGLMGKQMDLISEVTLFYLFILFWLPWVFIAVCWGFSLVVAQRLSSCPTASGILIPQRGIEPVSPALEGGLLTTGPPGKSHGPFINCQMLCRCKAGWEYRLWLLAMSPQEAVPSQQCPAGHGHHAGRADQLACWQHWGGAWHDLQSLCHPPGHTRTLSSHHQGLRGKWHLGAGLGSLKMKAEY